MLIDTDTIDHRAVAIALLKRGGMDWIDKPADEMWGEIDPEARADREQWREGIIIDKTAEVKSLLAMVAEAASAD